MSTQDQYTPDEIDDGTGHAGHRDRRYEPATSQRRFQPLSIPELLKRREPSYLIQGILYEGLSALLYGKSERFKSAIALHMAMCIATGTDFLGRKVRQRSIVYVVGEGDGLWTRRVQAWLKAYEFDQIPDHVPAFFVLEAPQIHNPADVTSLLAAIYALKRDDLGAIFIDTLAACSRGLNENFDMGSFTAGVDDLRRETGAAVITTHHTGWRTDHPRGNSSLPASMGLELHVDLDDKQSSRSTTKYLWIRCEKNRHGPHFPPMYVKAYPVDLGVDDDGQPVSACVIKPATASTSSARGLSDQQLAVLLALDDYLAAHPNEATIRSGVWEGASGLNQRTFYRYRDRLVAGDYVHGDGHQGYRLTDLGRAEVVRARKTPAVA